MKRVVIGIVAVGLIIAIVFGMTFISELTDKEIVKQGDTRPDGSKPIGQPLIFSSSFCRYDPNSSELQNRMFRGFYEVGETDTIQFWFKNRSDRPITITSKGASCTTCSGARITHVTPEAMDKYTKGISLAGAVNAFLPFGGIDFVAAATAVDFDLKLPWQKIHLDKRDSTLTLPPTGTPEKPGLGMVQLQLTASQNGSRAPEVGIQAGVADEPPTDYKFQMNFVVVGSFAVMPLSQDVGEIQLGVAPKPFQLITWSATREFGERFPPPVVRPAGDDPFIQVGPAEKMTNDELEKLNYMISYEAKIANRVRSGYRYSVSVLREANGLVADIGPFSKTLNIAGNNDERTSIAVTGTVTGLVRLGEGKEINFGTYEAKYAREMKATLISDKPDMELNIVPGEIRPRFLAATLEPPTQENGGRVWKLKLKINENEGFQANWNGVVVLKSTGPNPITIRVPVKGNGTRR